ncbi:MAG: hypothetical protein RJA56_665, partial [Pseudomonadota bacterium]
MSRPGPRRLPTGGRIERAQRADFFYNGQTVTAFAGDTVASALLAAGHRVVARSFKYHRPRGIVTSGIEEPSALVQLESGANTIPNAKMPEVELYDALQG